MRALRTVVGSMLMAATLGACAVFAPAYDPTLASETNTAYQGVSQILASAQLGAYADPSSYSGAQAQYVNVTAALSIAAARAGAEPVAARGTGEQARDKLVGLIQGCRSQVLALAQVHQRRGIPNDAGFIQPVQVACDEASRAVTAMQNH
ncbi:MAG: hypothetical protein JSR45_18405 [Proteobacteria bacterium]|nr:hypothetical protein [Pseudomonadota bacterium]